MQFIKFGYFWQRAGKFVGAGGDPDLTALTLEDDSGNLTLEDGSGDLTLE